MNLNLNTTMRRVTPMATAADLDQHEAERLPVPKPIKSVEAEHPVMWALYALAVTAGFIGSAFYPGSWFGG